MTTNQHRKHQRQTTTARTPRPEAPPATTKRGGNLSLNAAAGWDRLTRSYGVTLTSLMEVLGLHMEEHRTPESTNWVIHLDPELPARARALDQDRRSRRPM